MITSQAIKAIRALIAYHKTSAHEDWSNDAVGDPPGEILYVYVRDEESGEIWGPTVLPIREEDDG